MIKYFFSLKKINIGIKFNSLNLKLDNTLKDIWTINNLDSIKNEFSPIKSSILIDKEEEDCINGYIDYDFPKIKFSNN